MSKNLTILMVPVEGVGHVNACIGIAQCLKFRGHRIIFVVEKSYEGRLIQYGFDEEILDNQCLETKNPGEDLANDLIQAGVMKGLSSLEKIQLLRGSNLWIRLIKRKQECDQQFKTIVNKYKPDIIFIDDVIGAPSLIYSNIPWVLVVSTNPLFMIKDERTPPGESGYPIDGNRSEWKQFDKIKAKSCLQTDNYFNQWMKELGLPQFTGGRYIPDSPFLNIYGFPEELDYSDVRPLPDKWLRVDSFTRRVEQDFKLPENFRTRNKITQKIVYFSLGSMGSVDIDLMKRLINILSKSSHKYIVSKGLLGDKYELADNMWGQNSVPQTKVLPLVDLVITHGGNNTVTETFSFGKPMIVMPLFGDQYDNAQRVHEKRFGIRLEPYNCTEEELLGAVEKLLNDQDLIQRLNVASKRMLSSDSIQKVSEVIEKIAKNFKYN